MPQEIVIFNATRLRFLSVRFFAADCADARETPKTGYIYGGVSKGRRRFQTGYWLE